jgi:hypothetical protein
MAGTRAARAKRPAAASTPRSRTRATAPPPTTTEPAACCAAFSTNSGQDPIPFSTPTGIDAARLDLHPGKYVLNAKVLVGNRTKQDNEEIVCTLRRGQTGNIWIDTSAVRVHASGPWTAGSSATLPLTGTVTLSAAETIRLHCDTTSSDAFAQWAQLNAVAVDSITT